MDFGDDFVNILILLKKLVKLIRRRNHVKTALKNEIQQIKSYEQNSKISIEENAEVRNGNPIKAVFKKSDLMPSGVPQTYKPPIKSSTNDRSILSKTFEFVIKRNTRNRSEMCDLCGIIIRRSNMEFHMNAHYNRKPFVCDFKNCKKSFSAPSTLFRHRKLHTEAKEFSCDLCSAKFHYNGNLQKHKTTHLEPKFKCTVCGHMFKTSTRLKYHMYTHRESQNLNCTFPSCDRKFKNSYSVREHLRRFHNIKVRERVAKPSIYQENL